MESTTAKICMILATAAALLMTAAIIAMGVNTGKLPVPVYVPKVTIIA